MRKLPIKSKGEARYALLGSEPGGLAAIFTHNRPSYQCSPLRDVMCGIDPWSGLVCRQSPEAENVHENQSNETISCFPRRNIVAPVRRSRVLTRVFIHFNDFVPVQLF